MDVQIPGQILNANQKDILGPLKELQQGLGLLPTDTDIAKSGVAATFVGPPDSIAIIEAGATALSKWWSVVIAGLGGTAVITSAVTKFWDGQKGGERIALIGGMAGLLIAALITISIIVAADVKGRAQGTVAIYAARASIATHFLQDSLRASQPVPTVAQGNSANGVKGSASGPNSGPDSSSQAQTQEVPIYLAASSAPAAVVHKPSNQAGHLAGVRQLNGAIQLLFVRETDQQTTWCAVGDITVTEFTYPAPAKVKAGAV